MASRFLLAAAMSLALVGCRDSQGQCIETAHVLGPLSSISPGGISGQELLLRTGGTHRLRLHEDPGASRNDVITTRVNSESGTTLQILPSGADYQLIQSRVDECVGVNCNSVGLACLDRLELPVQVFLKSEDGVFNEHWFGMLTAGAPSDPELSGNLLRQVSKGVAWVNIDLAPKEFGGSFEVLEVTAPDGYQLQEHRMTLLLRFEGGRLADGKLLSELSFESQSDVLKLRETDVWLKDL